MDALFQCQAYCEADEECKYIVLDHSANGKLICKKLKVCESLIKAATLKTYQYNPRIVAARMEYQSNHVGTVWYIAGAMGVILIMVCAAAVWVQRRKDGVVNSSGLQKMTPGEASPEMTPGEVSPEGCTSLRVDIEAAPGHRKDTSIILMNEVTSPVCDTPTGYSPVVQYARSDGKGV